MNGPSAFLSSLLSPCSSHLSCFVPLPHHRKRPASLKLVGTEARPKNPIPANARARESPLPQEARARKSHPRKTYPLCLSRFRGAEVTFRFRFFPLRERAICSTRTKHICRKPIGRLLLFDRRQPWTDAHTIKKTAASAPIRRRKPLLSRPRLKPKLLNQPESKAFLKGFRFRKSPLAHWLR